MMIPLGATSLGYRQNPVQVKGQGLSPTFPKCHIDNNVFSPVAEVPSCQVKLSPKWYFIDISPEIAVIEEYDTDWFNYGLRTAPSQSWRVDLTLTDSRAIGGAVSYLGLFPQRSR